MLPRTGSRRRNTEEGESIDLDLYISHAKSDEAEEKETIRRADTANHGTRTDYRRQWSPERQYYAHLFESIQFEFAMGGLLLFNFFVVVLESDSTAGCVYETEDISSCTTHSNFTVINTILLGVYCIEFGLKAAVWRRDLYRSYWNLFDGAIVFASLVETIIQLTGVPIVRRMVAFRIFRLVRLGRTVRLLEPFPELYFMLRGFASAIAAMWWGFLIIALWIMAWSILAVELVNPHNISVDHDTEYCEAAFSSVYNAFLLFFQTLVAGDSWGACILPILKDAPYYGFIFIGAMVSIQLGFTNLVLSCIVDAATKSRDTDTKLQARVKKTREIEAKDALVKEFVAMDRDKTGTISLEEFIQGYENDENMRRQLAILRISREDLDTVFGVIDEDNSGSLELGEFCRFIAGVQESDVRVSIMMLKTQLGRVLQKVEAIYAAMESVALVTGAAPIQTKSRRKPKLSMKRFGTRSYSLRRLKSNSSKPASSTSTSSFTLAAAAGKKASATSTAQRGEAAAKLGGEEEGAAVEAQCVVPTEARVIDPSSFRRGSGQGKQAAAKGGGESEEATAGATMDSANRTPLSSRSNRGSSSGRPEFGIDGG